MERVHDKINYQTNFTAPTTFAILLDAIKSNGIVESEDARVRLFPQARSKFMRYDPSNRDTHGEITLNQYGLIEYIDENHFKLSFLGERFLELFVKTNQGFVSKENNEMNYISVMVDSLISWKDSLRYTVYPGLLLLRLLSDERIGCYITDNEWSFICEHSSYRNDNNYEELIQELLVFRNENRKVDIKKADVFLGGFSGKWNIFRKEDGNKFFLTESTKSYFLKKKSEWKSFCEDNTTLNRIIPRVVPQKGGINKIYLGAPGCGKSRHIKDKLKNVGVEDENVFRVTFHPEYANCDFIGQIMPEIKKGDTTEDDVVIYKFNPGPFSLALKRAYNTEDMVYLIVEEINRGNAAAIFGDTFQLLDRIDDKNDPYYCASEYPIKNPHMEEYLKANVLDDTILDKLDEEGIYIPSNLTIYATMNTSDQNVFTLDTAFKRRWSQEQIRNDIKSDNSHPYKNYYVPGTDVTWETFMLKINDKILENKIQNSTNEDKRLGKYFISSNCLTENVEKIEDVKEIAYIFAYKVLEYIWNDVCKIGRENWFDDSDYKTLEDLIDGYVEKGLCLDVFNNIKFKDED